MHERLAGSPSRRVRKCLDTTSHVRSPSPLPVGCLLLAGYMAMVVSCSGSAAFQTPWRRVETGETRWWSVGRSATVDKADRSLTPGRDSKQGYRFGPPVFSNLSFAPQLSMLSLPLTLPDLNFSLSSSTVNSTLMSLIQQAQLPLDPASLAQAFSEQFAKPYMSKLNELGLKMISKQSLTDLIRLSELLEDGHRDPKVEVMASRIRSQLWLLQQNHEAKVAYFFNEPVPTIEKIPPSHGFPLPLPVKDSVQRPYEGPAGDAAAAASPARITRSRRKLVLEALFGREDGSAGRVRKRDRARWLFGLLLGLHDWGTQAGMRPDEEAGLPATGELHHGAQSVPSNHSHLESVQDSRPETSSPSTGPITQQDSVRKGGMVAVNESRRSTVLSVYRVMEEVWRRVEGLEGSFWEEALVKTGLRLEFEMLQLLEVNRYVSETMQRTRQALNLNNATEAAWETWETLRSAAPPQLLSVLGDLNATLSSSLPFKLNDTAIKSVFDSVRIGHRPEKFPKRDWAATMAVLTAEKPLPDPHLNQEINHPLFFHSMLLLATMPYNLKLSVNAETDPGLLRRSVVTASKALGVAPGRINVQHVVSDKACATVVTVPEYSTTIVSFRGTREPVDVLTDINFLSTVFKPRSWHGSNGTRNFNASELRVHGGFKVAFDSVKDKVSAILEDNNAGDHVLFVGHSMGGALAQLASVYFCDMKPRLVTFASPAIGNDAFCMLLECCAQPYGGLRVWNEYDVVTSIAQLVGYKHGGVSIRLNVSRSARDLFEMENVASVRGLIELLAPHVMFQIGPCAFVFPVLGWEVQSTAWLTLAEAAEETAQGDLSLPELPPPPLSPAGAAADISAVAGVASV